MASPEENLREELVRFLTHIPPSRLPSRADGGHYAVALAPCCTPALKRQCEAADAALARLRAATREDGRPGAAAAHAEAVAEAARAAAAAVAAVRASLEAGAATDARVAPGGLAVSWTSSLGPGDAIGVVADYDARKPMFAVAEALLPTLVACARLDEALACAAGARAGERRAARALAEDAAAGLQRAAGALKDAAGLWQAAAKVDAAGSWHALQKVPAEASPAVATARGDACLAAADRLVVRKGLALNNPVTARLADGAADRAAAAAMALGCPETAFEGLVAFAAADLLRARQAAAKSDAATFGDAVAHARRGRDRLAALAGAGAWPGPPPAAADLVKLAGRATAGRLGAAAAAYYDELKHTNERVYYAKVPDSPPPAAAPLPRAEATPFVPEAGPPAPLAKPADDDPLLDAFDAARSEAVAARREAAAAARREDEALARSQQELLAGAREERLDRRDAAAAAVAQQRGLGGVDSFFNASSRRAEAEARDAAYARSLQEASARARREAEARDAAYARSLQQEQRPRAPPAPPELAAAPAARPPAPPAPPSWTRDATPCADALADRLDRLRAAPSAPDYELRAASAVCDAARAASIGLGLDDGDAPTPKSRPIRGTNRGLRELKAIRLRHGGRLVAAAGSVVAFGGCPGPAAIVNAANARGFGGGGVDGAVSRAGGPALRRDRAALPQDAHGLRIGVGDCVATGPNAYGQLRVEYVLHAVGPDFRQGGGWRGGEASLVSAYAAALRVAREKRVRHVAFSLLSAGVYRGSVPLERVVSVGLRAIASHAYPGLDEVYVCAYSREEKEAVCDALDALENETAPSEDADRRYAERLRAELDEERARERAANEARDAAYARSLQQDSARARREAEARDAAYARSLQQRAAPAPSGTAGWTTYTDPETGHAYDYNAQTGQSRWATPESDEPPPPPRNPFAY